MADYSLSYADIAYLISAFSILPTGTRQARIRGDVDLLRIYQVPRLIPYRTYAVLGPV